MEENMNQQSKLRARTRLPQFSSSVGQGYSFGLGQSQNYQNASTGLQEITDSQSNARAQPSMVTGPNAGLKRSLPAPVSQPDAKRKNLVERAGSEFPGKTGAPPGATGTRNVKGATLKELNRPLGANSNGFTGPRHISSNSYTSNSSSSYATSVGPGGRPPSRNHTRARSTTRIGRPATSLGTRDEGHHKNDSNSNNNGTVPPSRVLPANTTKPTMMRGKKLRKSKSAADLSSSVSMTTSISSSSLSSSSSATYEPIPADREASICKKLDSMSLGAAQANSQGNQASSRLRATTPPNSPMPANVSMRPLPGSVSARRRGGRRKRKSEVRNQKHRDSPVAPATPQGRQLMTKLEDSIKAAVTPSAPKFSSPTKPPFLSKNSNLKGYLVTDIDERVGRMDSELQKVREFMESTEKSSASVKGELEAAKQRAAILEDERNELRSEKIRLRDRLDDTERQVRNLDYDLQQERRRHEKISKEMEEDHRRILANKDADFNREMDKLEKLQQEFEEKCGAEAEARLDNLSNENRELRNSLEKQKRDHEHEVRLLNEDLQRRESELHKVEEDLRKALHDHLGLEAQVRGNVETIDRLRKRAEDAEERLSKDKGHLGGQISLLSSTLDLKSERIQHLEEETKALRAKFEEEVENIKLAAQKEIAEETEALRMKLIKEEERRHKLFEQVQELKGNIRVMCRIKPPSDRANDALIKFNPRVSELDEEKIDGLVIPTEREDFREPGKMIPGKPKDFNFERVFDDRCSNRDVFDEISQLVQSVMDGKKVCIFCYGQTGSGKTYTMSKRQGDDDDGIIPRTQGMIFSEVDRLKALGWEYTVEGSYLEVYQDKLYDLLASRHTKPEPLMVDPIGDELNIKGHDFTLLNDERDLDNMVKTADNNRHVAATAKNDRSSRSHSILVLKINGTKRNEAGEVVKVRKGTLNLIDLAGSETPDKNGPPQVYREGVEINSSLSYLRTVLASLGQGKTEGVDFRSYTLTQLLRPSLGKGCRTLMFVMVSPLKENENETVRSLEFAKDAQKVKMGGNGGSKSRK